MNADQAKFLAAVIGQNLQGEWMHTYKVINSINDAKKDYKPASDSRSAWDLAHHLAVCDVGFLQAVAANSFANFPARTTARSEEHTSEFQSLAYLVCRLLLEKKKKPLIT